jgi:hypothetical protein
MGACEGHPEKFNLPRRSFASMAFTSDPTQCVSTLPDTGIAGSAGGSGLKGTTVKARSNGVDLFLEIEPADA